MIEILLLEKNLILSNHLKKMFDKDKQLNVIGICTEGNQILEFLKNNSTHIVLMDHLQTNGLVVTKFITENYPAVKVIGFSTYEGNNGNDMNFRTWSILLFI